MEEFPKKLGLEIYQEKFTQEKISANIASKLFIVDLQKTEITERWSCL